MQGWITGWKAIAKYFDVSIRTAKRWHKSWQMPLLKIGKSIVSKAEDLDLWAQRKGIIF